MTAPMAFRRPDLECCDVWAAACKRETLNGLSVTNLNDLRSGPSFARCRRQCVPVVWGMERVPIVLIWHGIITRLCQNGIPTMSEVAWIRVRTSPPVDRSRCISPASSTVVQRRILGRAPPSGFTTQTAQQVCFAVTIAPAVLHIRLLTFASSREQVLTSR